MDFFAVDIGSVNIKVARISHGRGSFSLEAVALAPSPGGSVASASDTGLEKIAQTIVQLKQDAHITTKNVVASMPESEVFVRTANLPKMTLDELSTAISWEAEQYIPLPIQEVNYSYTVVGERPDGGLDVLIVAAPTRLIDKYDTVLKMAGLEAVALETELLALSRCVVRPEEPNPVMVVDIGARSTDIAIIQSGQVVFSRAISMAGAAMTRSLMNGLQIDETQAETFKRTYGLNAAQVEGKVALALNQVLQSVVAEVSRTLTYYSTRTGTSVNVIYLAGGTAILPELVPTFTNMLNVEVQLANVWTRINDQGRSGQVENPTQYAVVLGLAMKEV